LSALGDIIHALPVLDDLHKASPGIEIDWVLEEMFREIVFLNAEKQVQGSSFNIEH